MPGTKYTRDQLYQARTFKTVRRVGLAADLDGAGTKNLFTIAGSPVLVYRLFGHVTTVIGAGLAVPRLQFTPTGGAMAPLCAAAAAINADAVDTLYTWTGLVAGLLTPGAQLGILDLTGAEAGFASPITLIPGVINLTNAVDAVSGVIDWYISYLPLLDTGTITAA